MKNASRLSRIVFTCLLATLALSGAVGCGSSDGGGPGSGSPLSLAISVTGIGSGHVTSNVGNINCTKAGGVCTASLNGGTTVTLTAIPDLGFFFNGWLGACHGAVPCTLTLSQAASVQASFVNIAFKSNRDLDPMKDTPDPVHQDNIWLVNSDGSHPQSLVGTTVIGVSSNFPTFSPDGNQILFTSNRDLNDPPAPSHSGIWVVNTDGNHLHPLARLDTTDFQDDFSVPRWSPDGSRIVFASNRDIHGNPSRNLNGSENIWVVNSNDTDLNVLAGLDVEDVFNANPVWSPDGTKIAFESNRSIDLNPTPNPGESENIWIVNPDGSGLKALTNISTDVLPAPSAFSPQWSPDGSQLAFVSDRNLDPNNPNGPHVTSHNIWKMNSDGSNPTHLTADTGTINNRNIQWSPDGKLIVFESNQDPKNPDPQGAGIAARNIWVVPTDGSQAAFPLTSLTATQIHCEFPYWAPDGSVVIFNSNRDLDPSKNSKNDNDDIWIVNPDGSGNAAPITKLINPNVFNESFYNND